jgi:hypothetical protein
MDKKKDCCPEFNASESGVSLTQLFAYIFKRIWLSITSTFWPSQKIPDEVELQPPPSTEDSDDEES